MLGRGGAQAVDLNRAGHDRRHLALGHLAVGLVLQRRHLARDAAEGDHGAGPGIADRGEKRIEHQRSVGDTHVGGRDRAARYRWDQGHLVAGVQHLHGTRVLLVDGHDDGDSGRQLL
jgi:hypothetical protein